MTGFILKDFLVMKKTLYYYLFLLAVYSILAVTGVFTYTIISSFTVMLGAVAPVSAFAYDEQARWDKFAAATPVGRQGVVKARYLFTLLLLLGGGVLSVLVSTVVVRMTNIPDIQLLLEGEPLAVTTATLLLGVLLDTVLLPILFKFGAEKARIILIAIVVAVVGGTTFLLLDSARRMPAWLVRLDALPPALLVAAPVVVIFALFWLSYRISVGIYQRKEL